MDQNTNQEGGEPHGQGLQPGMQVERVTGWWGAGPRPATQPAPCIHSPQGYLKLEHLPDDPDVAQEAATVDALV